MKNLSVMQDTQILSLGQEDPLEKGMATHSSILAWRIPWTEEPFFQLILTAPPSRPSSPHFFINQCSHLPIFLKSLLYKDYGKLI